MRLRSVRRKRDGVEHLRAGPDILRRLSGKEQDETGKAWRWECHACPYHEGEQADMAAALRLRVAVPSWATVERVGGERLRRYTFRVEGGHDHEDAVIARVYDHLRHHQTTRILFDAWLADDGGLRRTRERARVRRQAGRRTDRQVGRYTLLGATMDHWDFGVTTEIAVPLPEQILGAPDGPAAP